MDKPRNLLLVVVRGVLGTLAAVWTINMLNRLSFIASPTLDALPIPHTAMATFVGSVMFVFSGAIGGGVAMLIGNRYRHVIAAAIGIYLAMYVLNEFYPWEITRVNMHILRLTPFLVLTILVSFGAELGGRCASSTKEVRGC
jgi:hypothetical protein